MIQKLKKSFLVTVSMIAMLAPSLFMVAVPISVSAANQVQTSVCQGANFATEGSASTDCSTGGASGTDGIKNVAKNIINIFSIIVGVVAVIFIIYGGFKYITSGGDSGNVSAAKNTIIYAIIGLIIVALSQFIVHYVLTTTDTITTQ